MWDYSEKVKEHFFAPRNAGAVTDANAVGDVGSLSCGDALRLTLRVNPDTDVIEDAGFQTFGCGSAIASSSALTEIIKGKTVEQALTVTNQDIADYLDGLPPEKMHCSVMGHEALHAAIANYRGEAWHDDDHEEGALLCKCFAIDEKMVERTIRENHLTSIEEVIHYTKAGGSCASCHEGIERVLNQVLAETNTVPPTQPVVAKAEDNAPSLVQTVMKIQAVLDQARPALLADGGDIQLVDIVDNIIYVHMTGACSGCMMAAATLGGLQQQLIEALGRFVRVLPDTERMTNTLAMGA